jgi:type I restriction enzyme, R subunit
VDKMLGGVQCIQTLSRLNRCHPDKEDTQIVDFVNTFDDVRTSFAKYYRCTHMEGEMDVQKLYDYRTDMEAYRLFTTGDVEQVARVMVEKGADPVELSAMMRRLSDAVKEREPEEQMKYRKLVNRYVRQYGFLAQIMDFIDADLEKLYVFCKLYYKFLPYTRETLPADLLEQIDLDKYKVQLGEQGIIELEDEDGVLKPKNDRNMSNPEKDYEELSELLKEINEPYRGFLTDNDKLIHHILELLKEDPEVVEAFSAHNTTDVLMDLMKRKFQEKAYGMMNKYLDLMTVMNTYQSFTDEFFRKAFDMFAEWTRSGDRPEYDEDLLKELMTEKMADIFAPLETAGHRALSDVIDILFDIFRVQTLPSLDGMNKDVPHALNNLYRAENRLVDYRLWYRSICNNYEPFLKKVYYLLKNEAMPEPPSESKQIGLAYVGKHFRELSMLHYREKTLGKNYDGTWRKEPMNAAYNQMADFYQHVYDWRNENAHDSADLAEDEITMRLDQFIAMYLFSVMMNASDLEQNIDTRLSKGKIYRLHETTQSMAAEGGNEGYSDMGHGEE